VATAARSLGAAALAMLAACGQKGPLIGVKPTPPAIVPNVAPDAAADVPAARPASAPAPR